MAYCPRCQSEYEAGITQCPDCMIDLVDRPPHESHDESHEPTGDVELTEVFTAQEPVSAYAIKDRLESAGIPAMVKTMDTTYYDGITVAIAGYWGKVYVSKDDLERATRIVEEALAQLENQP